MTEGGGLILTFQTKNKGCKWSSFAKSQIPREPETRSRNQPRPLPPAAPPATHALAQRARHRAGPGAPVPSPRLRAQALSVHTPPGDGVSDSICRGQDRSGHWDVNSRRKELGP